MSVNELYPHAVTIPWERAESLFVPGEDEEYSAMIAWLCDRDGGPLLVTTLSADPDMPFERPEVVLPDTCQVEVWDFQPMIDRQDHMGRGTTEPPLEKGYVRFNFANPDTATLFKLTFGGDA